VKGLHAGAIKQDGCCGEYVGAGHVCAPRDALHFCGCGGHSRISPDGSSSTDAYGSAQNADGFWMIFSGLMPRINASGERNGACCGRITRS
jgi:hypothetical protein